MYIEDIALYVHLMVWVYGQIQLGATHLAADAQALGVDLQVVQVDVRAGRGEAEARLV